MDLERTGSERAGSAAEGFTLAVDIGNTHTVIGLFQDTSILRRWRLPTRKDSTEDEIAASLNSLLLGEERLRGSIEAMALASVVPLVDEIWLSALERCFGTRPRILDYAHCLGLRLAYEFPRQIGADRLANVLGAYALGHREGVVVDLGTATTFDVFSDYTYWGGIICPGIQTSLGALVRNASKLAEVELHWTEKVIGQNTDDAIRAGLLHGTLGQTEYLLRRILEERKMDNPMVIATGGLARVLFGRSALIQLVEPDLTLIGLNHVLRKGKEKA